MKEEILLDTIAHVNITNGLTNIIDRSNKLTRYENFYLKQLFYLSQGSKVDKSGYYKYSYDFILGFTRRELTIPIQNAIIDLLSDSEFVKFKKVNNKVVGFKLNSSKINDLVEEILNSIPSKKIQQPDIVMEKLIKYKTYIIEDEHTHLFKIGRSKNISDRYKTLQSTAPLLKLIMKSEDDTEKFLHEKFKNKQVRGEWFSLDILDLDLLLSEFNFKLCQNEK